MEKFNSIKTKLPTLFNGSTSDAVRTQSAREQKKDGDSEGTLLK